MASLEASLTPAQHRTEHAVPPFICANQPGGSPPGRGAAQGNNCAFFTVCFDDYHHHHLNGAARHTSSGCHPAGAPPTPRSDRLSAPGLAGQKAGKARPPAFSLRPFAGPSHFRPHKGSQEAVLPPPVGGSCPGKAGEGLRHLTPKPFFSHGPILPLPQAPPRPHRQEAAQTQGPLCGAAQGLKGPEWRGVTRGTSSRALLRLNLWIKHSLTPGWARARGVTKPLTSGSRSM